MKTMTITIDRKPLTIMFDGQQVQVEELSIRLPFGRKPTDIKDIAASGNDVVYVTETRTMTPEEFEGYTKLARAKGFLMVSASPLTRSSHHAGADFQKLKAVPSVAPSWPCSV